MKTPRTIFDTFGSSYKIILYDILLYFQIKNSNYLSYGRKSHVKSRSQKDMYEPFLRKKRSENTFFGAFEAS